MESRAGRMLRRSVMVTAAAVLSIGCVLVPVQAREAQDSAVALSDLPVQVQRTHALVLAGGPFPYAKDGTVFGNRERLLPRKARGFYREYTVKTPGVRHRGARRLVCGGEPPTRPEACYYTEDHYSSFRRIQY
ncbi:ribonuclease domain-containing protein [Inhella inkyongensis]